MPAPEDFPLVEKLHEQGFFIVNNHLITHKEFIALDKLINTFVRENND